MSGLEVIAPLLGSLGSLVGAFMQPEAPEAPPLPPTPELPKVYAPPNAPSSSDIANSQRQYEADIAKRTKAGLLDNNAAGGVNLLQSQTGVAKQGILATKDDTTANATTSTKKTLLGK